MALTDGTMTAWHAIFAHELDEHAGSGGISKHSCQIDESFRYFQNGLKSFFPYLASYDGFDDLEDSLVAKFISFFKWRLGLDFLIEP